jgi:hypothetical protein
MGSNSMGLKSQFGVGDPNVTGQGDPKNQSPASDKQVREFQTMFQKEQGRVNELLQYTALHAEASRHGALATRRDAMYAAFQFTLAKIDQKDPLKAQGEIDKVLADVRALAAEAGSLRQQAEKAQAAWDSRLGKYDEAVHQIEQLEAWQDAKSPTLRGLVDGIRNQVNLRQFAQATATIDALLPKLAPIYEASQKQRAAKTGGGNPNQVNSKPDPKKQQYEAALASLLPRLQAASKIAPLYAKLAPMQVEIAALQVKMAAAAKAGDYDSAIQHQKDIGTKLDAFEVEAASVSKQDKDKYTKARDALKPKLADALVSARRFGSLKSDRAAIVTANAAVETAANAQNFAKAAELLTDLGTKVDAYLKAAKTEEAKYKKKGDEIAKQLAGATKLTRSDVAKAAAKALSDDELQFIPTTTRNALLAAMQKDGLTDDDKAACKLLFSKNFLDPEFEKIDDANRQKMIANMKKDPAFKKARDNWNTLTEAERVAIMKKAVDYQADAYGVPKTTIAPYSKAKSKNGSIEYGYYDHADGKLFINTNDDALKDGGFDEAIDTAVHENGHRYQNTLVDQLDAGKIKPGDPLYNQAMTFKLNDTSHGFYVQPPGDTPSADTGDEYFTQPLENHSRLTGAAVQNAGLGK